MLSNDLRSMGLNPNGGGCDSNIEKWQFVFYKLTLFFLIISLEKSVILF